MNKALTELSQLPHNAIDFDAFVDSDFLPTIKAEIEKANKLIEDYKNGTEVNFHDVVEKLDQATEGLDMASSIFYNLHSSKNSDEIEKSASEISKALTQFSSDISLDEKIFARFKRLYEKKNELGLDSEQARVVELSYKGFTRNGALLDTKDKETLRKIDERLSELSLLFSQNVLKATNSFEMYLDNEGDLAGLPEGYIESIKEAAAQKGQKDKWLVTLQYPSVLPFLTYSKKRDLRKRLMEAFTSKATKGDFDNQNNIKEIVGLRNQRAKLLGFKGHAEFVLKERMAESPEKVMSFLEELKEKSLPKAKEEFKKLADLQFEIEGVRDLQRYDSAYYTELLKQRELSFDDEVLRPYFKLENVIDGVFKVAQKLYGLKFKEMQDLPKYHSEVKVFEVRDSSDEYVGLFYADFFPRESKRGGAWMTNFMSQGKFFGKVRRPHVGIVCNFTKSTQSKPSLLTFNEVLTLFHEFGHALHGLLSQCTYTRVSGTSVYWDFVELPSQILENWVYEKECLDLFAKHYETGKGIPEELLGKIKESGKFLAGLGSIRQLSFAYLDMAYHMNELPNSVDIFEFEKKAMGELSLYPDMKGSNMSCAFSHIFAGGYSAGYYSYKWAEVLDADAFEYFKSEGIFSERVAKLFRENILERGGTEHPMELYKKFRGKEPHIDALMRRSGLL